MILKKLDKIVLFPFLKLFSLIFVITVFIMLMQFFLIYFDELIGKDLGFWLYLQFFFYFGITVSPAAFALATLVSSLMVFGSLGESLELIALKNTGITFLQTLRPLIIFITMLSIFVYYSNSYIVPKVTLKAYTLLYDLRKKKPSIAIKEGVFYNGIPGYSIRVGKKLGDQKTLQDIIIYDHTEKRGNVNMTTAASGELTNSLDGEYFIIYLFQGVNYLEQQSKEQKKEAKTGNSPVIPDFIRISFEMQKILIALDDFKLNRTSEQYFAYYHATKTSRELRKSAGEMRDKIKNKEKEVIESLRKHYLFSAWDQVTEKATNTPSTSNNNVLASIITNHSDECGACFVFASEQNGLPDTTRLDTKLIEPSTESGAVDESSYLLLDDLQQRADREEIIQKTLKQAQDLKKQISSTVNQLVTVNNDLQKMELEGNKRAAYAFACLIMLFIGAPLGALIKRGGLGVPLLISTAFMLLYYVIDIFGLKWNRMGLISSELGAWGGNIVLIPFALFFFWQAQRDTHLLDIDGYRIRWRNALSKNS